MSRLRLKGLLEKWGYEVVVCVDGKKAWGKLHEKESPRLLILDWLMPEMEGVELCRKLRKNRNKPYEFILLLTTKKEKSDIIEAMEAGADDFLSKPFSPDELKVRVAAGKRILELNDKLVNSKRSEAMLEMAVNVAHEVNNPLSVIKMNAEMLMNNTNKTDPDYESLNKIKENTKRIAEFVKNIRNIRSHKYNIDPQTGTFRKD